MSREGAFFRLEGALVATTVQEGATFLGTGAPSARHRLVALGVGGLAAALAAADPAIAARVAWAPLAGLSRDRVEVLGADWARDELVPRVRPEARRLLEESRALGRVLVLVAEAIDAVAQPFADALGIEHVICSRLAWDGEVASGKLREPRVGPEIDPRALRALASREGIDLARSAAYGSRGSDAMLLSLVGLPCAIAPDRNLSRIARDLDWPLVVAPSGAERRAPERLLG